MLLSGIMYKSMGKSIITLLYKRKGQGEDIRNWLNAGYKILSKVITNWVRSALGLVTLPDQTCAVLGRTISGSVAVLGDMIPYVQDSGVDACLISLGQEKAFDGISYTYMWDMLPKMGFGEGISNWIRLLYTSVITAVSINGFIGICDRFVLALGAKKLAKKNTFDHKAIRKWSTRSVLETLKEKVDPVGWLPGQNASSPALSNNHQDITWLVVCTSTVKLQCREYLRVNRVAVGLESHGGQT
eukprot:g36771.t1